MKRLRILITAVVIVLASLAHCQIAGYYDNADLVVLGTVESYDQTKSIEMRQRSSDKTDVEPISHDTLGVRLKVVKYFKGSGPNSIRFAIRKGNTDADGYKYFQVQLRIGKPSIWLLQQKRNGRFDADTRYWKDQSGDRGWIADGFNYATATLMNSTICVPIETVEFTESNDGMVSLADLMLRNAALRNPMMGQYLRNVQDLSYDEMYKNDDRDPRIKYDVPAMKAWFKNEYRKIFQPKDEIERLNDMAVRMFWGEDRDKETEFVEMLFQNRDKLVANLPRFFKTESIIVFAQREEAKYAREWFVCLREAPREYRRQILEVAVKRIGENHLCDAGILECIGSLYERPDLLPWDKESQIEKDLTPKLEMVREIYRKENGI